MGSSVAVIGDSDTVIGFKLGGVKEGRVVKNDNDAEVALDELINNDISIIIITEKIAENIREFIDKKVGSDVLPMIIEIPDKSGSSVGDSDPMNELIKRVIGVEMVK
jgi:V/A-type H+-transporting ATPase subunit F